MRLVSAYQRSVVQVLLRDRKEMHRILRVFRVAGCSDYLQLRSRRDFLFH